MNENFLHTLNDRNQFLNHLETDTNKNNSILDEATKQIQNLQLTCDNITNLSKFPEKDALIPLGKNIYINGRILHTGEYYVKKTAHPESFVVLQTLDQTIESLQERIKVQKTIIDRAEYARMQLNERVNILKGAYSSAGGDDFEGEDEVVSEDLPTEIKSDKGIALKVGDYYEILEYED